MLVVDGNLTITCDRMQKDHPMLRFYSNAQMKYSFHGEMDYNSRGDILLFCTNNIHPSVVNLQVNYNFTLGSYVGLCLHHITGEFRSKAYTVDCFPSRLQRTFIRNRIPVFALFSDIHSARMQIRNIN